MSHHRRNQADEAQYVDDEEISQQVRDEKLCMDDIHGTGDPNAMGYGGGGEEGRSAGAPVDDSGYDGIDVTAKGMLAGESNDGLAAHTHDTHASAAKGRATLINRDPLGYYKVLGVSPAADHATIRKAFLSLSQSYHSDKHSQQDEIAQSYMNERFQQLTEAYEVLSDPRRRAAYDHSGSAGIARLELVPQSAVNATDVKKYLSLLQAEAMLKRTERLIASSSSATIHLSAAHYFSSYKALGLADEEEEGEEGDGSNQAAMRKQAKAMAGGKSPNIGAFANDSEGTASSSSSSSSAAAPSSSNDLTASASSSPATTSDGEEDATATDAHASPAVGSLGTPVDPITEEQQQHMAYEEAMRHHQAREAAERARLMDALERAPPRWEPSMRGMGVDHYPHLRGQHGTNNTANNSQQMQAELQKRAEAEAAAAAAEKAEEEEAQKKKAAAEEKARKQQEEASAAPSSPSPSPAQPMAMQQNVQVSEVMINGQPTLVAILPPQVAAAIRQQMGGNIKRVGGGDDGQQGQVSEQQRQGDADDNAPPQQQQQQQQPANSKAGGGGGGMLRKAPNARAIQALKEMPLMVLLSLDFVHMYNYPISDRTNLSFRAAAKKNMDSNNGSDGANVGLTLEHVLSPLNKMKVNVKATFNLLKLQFSHTRVLSVATTMTNKVTLYAGGYFLRDFSMSLTRRLTAALSMTNVLTLSAGKNGGSFVSSAQYALSGHAVVGGSVDIGFGNLGCGANYVAKVSKKVKVVFALRSSLLGGSTEGSYELWYARNPLEQVGISASVVLPYSYNCLTGVTRSKQNARLTQISILLARGDNSIRIPIVCVVNDHVAKLLTFGAIPMLGVSIGRLLARPFTNLHKAKAYQRARSLHIKAVLAARRRAQVEMLALNSVVAKKRATEEGVPNGGLVILSATYGVLHPDVAVLPPLAAVAESVLASPLSSPLDGAASTAFDGSAFQLTTDVTDALQSFVHQSTLVLAEGSKENLPGFYDVDPATTEKRFIKVTYLFKKRRHRVEIEASEALTLPMEEHVVAEQSNTSTA